VDIRVGKIVKAWPHPDSEKLWCEEVDIGEAKPRQIASGLRKHYTQVRRPLKRSITQSSTSLLLACRILSTNKREG